MKLPNSWLQSRLKLNIPINELADHLTSLGLEVEHIEGYAPIIQEVVVAEIQKVEPHPGADRLRIAQVFDGVTRHQVVCAASNCRSGIKVAFAKIGAKLTGGFQIKKAKIRGVESFGMLCALDELGYCGTFDGIYEFSEEAPLGTLAMDWINDPTFVLNLTPDLSHCLSLEGIARLVAAKLCLPFDPKTYSRLKATTSLKTPHVHLDSKSALQYACMLFDGAAVGPSPLWLTRKLEQAGFRSINNFVDIGNWVMLETGRPVHVFDADTLKGNLCVRSSCKGELLKRLDGVDQILEEGLLVVADQEGPVALAGVMGSRVHEVTTSTKRVLLEVALFEMGAVRSSAKKSGCFSESSRRFERGVPLDNSQTVFEAFVDLLEMISAAHPRYSEVQTMGEVNIKKKPIHLHVANIKRLLGIELSPSVCADWFHRIGCTVHIKGDEVICHVPSSRHDLELEEDLIDELMKLVGVDSIPRTVCHASLPGTPHAPLYELTQRIRRTLVGVGLQEIVTLDFVNSKQLQTWGMALQEFVELQNPPSQETDVLRPSLLPSMVAVSQHNKAQQVHEMAMFEVGQVYQAKLNPCETTALGILLQGGYEKPRWDGSSQAFDFYDIKGIVETLMQSLGVTASCRVPCGENKEIHPWLHPKQQAIWVTPDAIVLGHIGQVHPRILGLQESDTPLFYGEFSLKDLLQALGKVCKYRALPMYPGSSRDWTLTLPQLMNYEKLDQAIPRLGDLVEVQLLGIWRSEKLGLHRKNVTLRFHYRSGEKTLTQQEIEAQHVQVQQATMKTLNVDQSLGELV